MRYPRAKNADRSRSRALSAAGAAACAAALIVGCSISTGPETSSSSSAASTSAGAPAAASGALRQIDPSALKTALDKAARDLQVPGAMVELRTPQGDFEIPFGTIDLDQQTPPTPTTHFRIASNTKTFTSALIVLLAQDGSLKFDDKVSAYVPDVPNGDNITIAELLKMRSGLYNYTASPVLAKALDDDPGKAWTPQEVLTIAFAQPPNFAPNAEYEYCNTNYALLGLIAEKVGGKPLAAQFQDRLFGPLGMAQTSVPAIDDTAIPAPFSHGYMYGGSGFALADDPYPPEMQDGIKNGSIKPIDYTNQNSSYATAAGGAISTADDLATWMQALVTGKVFNGDFQKQWLDSLQAEDPAAPDGQKYGYGISFQTFGPTSEMYYHGGELPGFNSFMGHDPRNNVTLAVWTNSTLSADGQTTANALLPTILKQVYTDM